MARYRAEKIEYLKQDQLMTEFCLILSNLKSPKAVQNFLKDLLNRQERMMIIRRLIIAEMLEKGLSYNDIMRKMKCGPSTIARVARWLNFGRRGYKDAIAKKPKLQ